MQYFSANMTVLGYFGLGHHCHNLTYKLKITGTLSEYECSTTLLHKSNLSYFSVSYYSSFNPRYSISPGPYRGAMRECYHASCDSVRGENSGDFADFEFYAHTVRALTRAVSDLAEEEEGGRLCHFEVSVARGTFCDPTGRLLVTACVLSWWFYAFSDNRGQ